MTLDPKALEKAARELCAAEGHKDPDTMIFAAFAHDKPPRPRWTFYEDDASTAITAYLAATEADLSRHEPSDVAWKAARLAHETTVGPAKVAEAIRAAYEIDGITPRPAPVSGWRMVPVEPTPEMMRHFAGLPLEALGWARQARERAAYATMLAAAPEPPVSGWRDISTAPKRDRKKRTDVLLGSFPKGAIAVGEAHRPPRDCFTMMDGNYHAPTHWHPLPTPPKQQEPK